MILKQFANRAKLSVCRSAGFRELRDVFKIVLSKQMSSQKLFFAKLKLCKFKQFAALDHGRI